MGWDLVGLGSRFHFFRARKALGYKESLCGTVRVPISKDVPGLLEVNEDMCKTCLSLHGKKRWGKTYVS